MNVKPEVNVEFEQLSAVFHVGGDDIKGNVTISFTRLMKTQMIKIEFKGIHEYHWKKHNASAKKPSQRQNAKSDQHFNIKDMLLTPRQQYNDLFLQPGTHSFPFVFKLPDTLPPSFTSEDGRIEFFARVIVRYRDEGSMEVNEIRTEKPFVIKKSISDFPPKLLQNVDFKEQLTVSKFLSRSTVINVASKMPKKIYYRGETITLKCEYSVVNERKNKVSGVYAVLMQRVQVMKSNGRQEKVKSREVVRAQPILSGDEGSTKWSNFYIKVPPDVSLTVQDCGTITISYYVQIRVEKSNNSFIIPIVIYDNEEMMSAPRFVRRFSLTGSGRAAPIMIPISLNKFERNDPTRLSVSSIDAHRLYYSQE